LLKRRQHRKLYEQTVFTKYRERKYLRIIQSVNHLFTKLDFDLYESCTVELGYNVMKGTEYFVLLHAGVVTTEERSVMVNTDINWYHRISDAIDEVSHKPMLL
jgi:hypothetical protein